MRITIAIAVLAATMAGPSTTSAAECRRAPLVFTRASLWTPQGVRPNQEVVIVDGRIRAVGPSGRVERPAGARVIEARGDTLLPGLIDAHAHLVLPVPREIVVDPRRAVYPATTRQLLRSGVTSARIHLWDLEDGPDIVRESADDCVPMPRLQQGGPGFIGGSSAFDGREAWGVRDNADAVTKVQRVKAAGAQWIAIHELDQFDPAVLRAIVSAARDADLRIMAQGDTFAQVRLALDLGVDSLEYIDRSTAASYPADLLGRLKTHRQIVLVPPIGYYRRYMTFRSDATILDSPRLTEFMPDHVGRSVIDDLRDRRSKPATGAGLAIQQSFPTLRAKFRQLRAAGVAMIAGTDCGSTASFQADSIWWELDTWRRFGASVSEAVAATTSLSARALGLTDVGEITEGRRADFVLYRGSLAGTFKGEKIRAVVKGGVVFVDEGKWVSKP